MTGYIASQIRCPKCPWVLRVTEDNTLICDNCGDQYVMPSVQLEPIPRIVVMDQDLFCETSPGEMQ